jgi:predicted dehydrogenase
MTTRLTSRRSFLQTAGWATAPLLLPARIRGANAPSNRITVAMIGMGRQALYSNLPFFLHCEHTQVVAVCDVDRWRLQQAKTKVDGHYHNAACQAYTDWREVLARPDIDAIMNSTTDQWHVPISLAAVRRGKHVSCEKPLTLAVAEGRVLADAARRHGITFRTDSECRSHAYMHKTAELVRNGYLGNVRRIEVGVPTGDQAGGSAAPAPVPAELDYERWLGPAPFHPYCVDRVHPPQGYGRPGWMRCRDTCEGMITNWGTHTLDVAQLINDTERTGPVAVEATGEYPRPGSGLWGVLLSFRAQFRYANGVRLDYFTTDRAYVRVEGDEGWIQANWTGKGGLQASRPELLRLPLKAGDQRFPLRSEKDDFVRGIRERAPTMADAEVGHRTCSLGQIAHIAIQRGRPLAWDPQAERFTNDEGANALLHRPYRAPWKLEGA